MWVYKGIAIVLGISMLNGKMSPEATISLLSDLRCHQPRFPYQHFRSPVYSELHGFLENSEVTFEGLYCGFLPSQERLQSPELHCFPGEGRGASRKGSGMSSATQHQVKKLDSVQASNKPPQDSDRHHRNQRRDWGLSSAIFLNMLNCVKTPQKQPHHCASPTPYERTVLGSLIKVQATAKVSITFSKMWTRQMRHCTERTVSPCKQNTA